jgi:hypothetical protein
VIYHRITGLAGQARLVEPSQQNHLGLDRETHVLPGLPLRELTGFPASDLR